MEFIYQPEIQVKFLLLEAEIESLLHQIESLKEPTSQYQALSHVISDNLSVNLIH